MAIHDSPRSTACATLQEDLVLFVYDELQCAARGELEKHVETCESCRATVSEIRKLLPLTRAADEPPQAFWDNYTREMRQKLDLADSQLTWWQKFAAAFRPMRMPALATAGTAALVLFLTVGKGFWQPPAPLPKDVPLIEILPMAENLEFFRTMEVLDSLDLLEFMGNTDHDTV